MEDASKLLKIIPLIVVIGFFVLGIVLHSKREKEYEETKAKKKADDQQAAAIATATAIDAEIEMANQAVGMLPDIDSALSLLRTKYGWRELMETLQVHPLQLKLLRTLHELEPHHVNLPNMQADRYEEGERRVAKVVREISSPYDDIGFYGIDSFAQEPTAEMLRGLVSAGYVSTAEHITKNTRDFECELTPDGAALLTLDARFSRENTAKSYLRRAPCKEARKIITSVMYRCIKEVQKQSQGQRA